MALTEETIIDRLEVLEDGRIQVRIANIIKRDGVEVSRSFHRFIQDPGTPDIDTGDPRIENAKADARVQAVKDAVWTPEVVQAREEQIASQRPGPESSLPESSEK